MNSFKINIKLSSKTVSYFQSIKNHKKLPTFFFKNTKLYNGFDQLSSFSNITHTLKLQILSNSLKRKVLVEDFHKKKKLKVLYKSINKDSFSLTTTDGESSYVFHTKSIMCNRHHFLNPELTRLSFCVTSPIPRRLRPFPTRPANPENQIRRVDIQTRTSLSRSPSNDWQWTRVCVVPFSLPRGKRHTRKACLYGWSDTKIHWIPRGSSAAKWVDRIFLRVSCSPNG